MKRKVLGEGVVYSINHLLDAAPLLGLQVSWQSQVFKPPWKTKRLNADLPQGA